MFLLQHSAYFSEENDIRQMDHFCLKILCLIIHFLFETCAALYFLTYIIVLFYTVP